jgi:phosphinothricin acetyltransferase
MTAIIRPAEDADLAAILAIYSDAVRTTTAIWNDSPVDLDNRLSWLESRRRQDYPVLVAEVAGTVVGYGSFGDFRAFDGYRFTVEHSIYVDAAARRQGIATALLIALIERASALGKHVMVAGIAADNDASIALHARHGFTETGRMPEVGTKFGRWLDLVLMQKRL